jgi:hypothetical protein
MTEQLPDPRPRAKTSRKSNLFGILGICLLLVVVIAFYVYLSKSGLLPGSVTLTQTVMPLGETSPTKNGLKTAALPAGPWTPTPTIPSFPAKIANTDIPLVTEASVPTPPYTTDITPVLSACQYTLKPGKKDFLYSIYWKWGIYQKYPILDDFYAGISCAGLPANTGCAYQAADPDTTMPGWTLILPGVTPNTCLAHGGTPVP